MLRSGKHKGKAIEDVKLRDRSYCAWLVRAYKGKASLPRDLRKFAMTLTRDHGGVLTVGLHKGKFYDEVPESYMEWASDLIYPGDAIRDFADYVKKKRGVDDSYSNSGDDETKKSRTCHNTTTTITRNPTREDIKGENTKDKDEEKKNMCCVCVDNISNCAFVPCGHMTTCILCGTALEHCPICRAEIVLSLRIYV